jgi:diguanylate cyclase (GGDEF)-like protein
MGREDFYPILRDDLYLFLAFLLVCGVAILIIMSVQPDTMAPAAPPQAGFVSPAPGSPTAAPVERPQVQEEFPSDAQEAQQQSARALTSPRTGLVWAEHLEPRLKAELERASSSDQDISLARLRIDEPFADAKLPLVYAAIARMLLESLPLHDLIFETGNDSYTALMPDCDVDAAVRVLESFRKKAAAATIEGKNRSVSIGVSSRGGRLIDANVLVTEADTAVAKASREGGNQVIGFRADPARFRSVLSGSRS